MGIKRGATGRIEMNSELPKFMNSSSSTGKYRLGAPVICLKKSTYKNPEGKENVYLFNGEIGHCVHAHPEILVDFRTDFREVG